ERDWCRVVESVPGEWFYCFEDMKGQPSPDYDFDEPVLHIERRDGQIQITVRNYGGKFHSDVFAFDRLIWRDVGGVEGNHVGDSKIVDLPEFPPVPEAPPAPPTPTPAEEPLAFRLDLILEVLKDMKGEMETLAVKANTYSVTNIDLSTARTTFATFTTAGFAMTVFSCTGTMDLRIGDIASDPITVAPLAYPQTLVIDRMDFKRFYVRNVAQPDKSAVLIIWKRGVGRLSTCRRRC
ncbi:unnamed protein product, partial [marine sediment metagenome]